MSRNLDNVIRTKKDKEVAEHLAKSPLTMQKFVKLYNLLCRRCKLKVTSKVKRGHNASFEDLCDACKVTAWRVFK